MARIIHDVIKTSKNGCVFWNDIVSQLDVSDCSVGNTRSYEGCDTKAFMEDSINEVKLRFVIQGWIPISSNNLGEIRFMFSLSEHPYILFLKHNRFSMTDVLNFFKTNKKLIHV